MSTQVLAPPLAAPARPRRARLRLGSAVQRVYVALFVAFMVAPLVVVVGASLEPRELLRFPPHGVSLHWYWMALQSSEFVAAARNSVIVAVLATLGGLLLGVPSAYAVARYDFRGRGLVSALLTSPLLVPQLVIGVALLEILALMGVAASILTLTLGHILIVLPYVVRTIHAAIVGLDLSVEEAAANLGANRLRIYTTVVLPIIRPALYSSVLFAFLISFDNAVISLFLVSARTTTLPIAMYTYVQYNLDPTIAAISSMLIGISLIVMYMASKLAPIDRINP
jgi:putative spermidine/putrescine transport system permease protein